MQGQQEYRLVYIHGRANLKTLILYQEESALEKTNKIENYYGFAKGIAGKELYETGIQQAKNIGVEAKRQEVIQILFRENGFEIKTENTNYKTRSIILATGSKKNKPNIKNIEEFEGRGVSYCAVCDGFFYKNKQIAVIGNGNYAISEVNELLPITETITILTNGGQVPEVRANSDYVKINTKEIEAIQGKQTVEEIQFKDGTTLDTEGIFIAQGVAGSMEFAKKLGIMTGKDKIVVNEKMETNIKGIYACGDCTGGLLQISKAVYEGTKAGIEVIQYIRKIKNG